MSKVLTFSRTFPAYHPKAGQPTYFVEKIYNSIFNDTGVIPHELANQLSLIATKESKHHTIRSGNRWKVGDKFSPRVWSGKPYNSKQIIIAPDIEVKRVWNFEIEKFTHGWSIDFGSPYSITRLPELAKNDGLELQDLLDWFKYPSKFYGQIICWNDSVNY